MSAIMKKLITTVVWVQPDWLNRNSTTIKTYDAFVGMAGLHGDDSVTVCTCKRKVRLRKVAKGFVKRNHGHYDCTYVKGTDDGRRKVFSIPHSTCRTINRFVFKIYQFIHELLKLQ